MWIAALLFSATIEMASGGVPSGDSVPWIEPGPNEPDVPVFWGQVNGHDVRILFDTGGDGVSMSPVTAERLGIVVSDRGIGRFAGGQESPVLHGKADSLRIGSTTFYQIQAMVIPGAEAVTIKDVTVGVELVRRARVLMDYDCRRITLLSEPFLPGQDGATGVPFRIVQGRTMIVPATVNEMERHLHFDTGATFSLSLRRSDAESLGLVEEKTLEHGIGGSGRPVVTTGYRDTVHLCVGALCRDVRVISLNEPDEMWDPLSGEYGQRVSGVVSHGFLQGMQVEYDAVQNVIWLRHIGPR